MGKGRVLAIVVVVIVVGFFLMNRQTSQLAPSPTPVPESIMKGMTVTLAEQNDSGESGTAVLKEVDGQVMVTLSLTGAPEGVSQPAHIHNGSCDNLGGIAYPLTNPMDGSSETMVDVTLDQLMSELPLVVNVHKSVSEAGVYVSCGDLYAK